MISFFSLASGSSGNCYYFTDGKVSFIIDAGVGPRSARKTLAEHGFKLDDISFILVTHDHIDHIKGLGIIAEKLCKPVYATQKQKDSFAFHSCTRGRNFTVKTVEILKVSESDGVKFLPFPVPHDAAETVGYRIEFDGKVITVATDLGKCTEDLLKFSEESDALIFESNYDEDMLMDGPYPLPLKNRICDTSTGHLSNAQAADALCSIYSNRKSDLRHIFLCHLSDNNNTPELAYNTVAKALRKAGASKENMELKCLVRGHASDIFTI